MKKTAFALKIVASSLLFLLGVVMVFLSLFSIFDIGYSFGNYSESFTYGGDAYTGIQNSIADTANNIYNLSYNIDCIASDIFHYSLSFIGIFLVILSIFSFAHTLGSYEMSEKKKDENKTIEELKKYKQLLDMGAISLEEYNAKKQALLAIYISEF